MATIWRSGYISLVNLDKVLNIASRDDWFVHALHPQTILGRRTDFYHVILFRDTPAPGPTEAQIVKEAGYLRERLPRDDERL